ncbi:MAG: hypothetical protein FJ102_07310 [Deltaproteobacteria bacterium]|nr:hypothetical protein [Deltaproteobacteria bacterium]
MSIDRSQDARMLARHLGAITRAIRIHDVGNRAVLRLLEWCARDLTELGRQHADARVELDQGVLVVNGTPVRMRRDVRTQLVPLSNMLRDVNSGGVKIAGVVAPADLATFFRALSALGKGTERAVAQKWLEEHDARSLQLLAPRSLVAGMSSGPGEAVRLAAGVALHAYIRAVLAVGEARQEGSLLRVPPPMFRAAQGLAELAEEDPRHHIALTTLKEDVEYETRHPVNSLIFAMALGRRLGLPRQLLVECGLCAALAATLPEEPSAADILGLTLEMLQSSRLTLTRARRMLAAFELHAGLDRTGPPFIPLDAPLHLFSRVAAIAVSFDSLTTTGPGRAGLLADEALGRMQEEVRGRYDPELLRLFAACVGRYPLGTAVTLDTGEVGVVIHTPSDPAMAGRPLVRLVRDERGRELRHGPLVDLADPSERRRVVGAVDAASLGIDARRALFG